MKTPSSKDPQAQAETKHTPDWEWLYQERAARLSKCIAANAPKPLVYMAARVLLQTEFHNSTRRMVWHWFVQAVRRQIGSWKSDICVLRLRWAGWPRECAIDIYFGDDVANHKKTGCECNANWKEFEREMRSRVGAK